MNAPPETARTTATRRHTRTPTALGELTIVARGEVIEGVYFPGHWHRPDPTVFGPRVDDDFDDVIRELAEYLAGRRREFTVPMRANGSVLQRRVWDLISAVPYGATTTYGALAAELGPELSAQEIGAVVGRNPLSVLVPCHRVVGSTGKLTGYAGGLRRKRFLLDLEQAGTGPYQAPLSDGSW